MGRGGKRVGAGRKRGSTNKKRVVTTLITREEAQKEARKAGELPHEFLLRVMRGAEKFRSVTVLPDGQVLEETRYPTLSERFDAAKAAAPYYAPRLVASIVEGHVDHEHHHEFAPVSDTAQWVADMLGVGAPVQPKKPLPH